MEKIENAVSASVQNPSKKKKSLLRSNKLFVFLMLAWPTVHFLVFWVYIYTDTIWLSFHTLRSTGYEFFGAQNFVNFFNEIGRGDSTLYYGIVNSIKLFFFNVIIIIPLSVFVAYCFFKKIAGYRAFRVIYFLPNVISVVIMTMVFRWAFDLDIGFMNRILGAVGISQPELGFFGEDNSFNMIMLYSLWVGIGYYVVILTLVGVLVPLQTSYVVAQYRFKLRKVYYAVAIMTISVPVVGGLASMIILLTKLKLFGTYVGIYVMGASGFGGSFLLFYSFFRSMSWSYAESAFIDGAGHFRVFVSINLPMAVPIIVSVMILSFLASWNDYFNVYMYAKGRPTLAVGIQFLGEMMMSQNRYPELFAFMMVSMVPGLVIFGVFQRTIMGNVSIGGLKG